MSKKLLVPVAVLLICAVVLFAANSALAGTAQANAEQELNDMISYLLPGGGEFEEIEYTGSDTKITNVYKGEGGYVLAMTANGYVDEIKLLVAVDNDGVIKGYTVRDIHERFDCTIVFVTHDFNEAAMLADRVGIVLEGRLRAILPAQELFEAECEPDVAAFLGRE